MTTDKITMTEITYRLNEVPVPAVVLVELTVLAMSAYPGANLEIFGIERRSMRGEWRWLLHFNNGNFSHVVSVRAE